MGTHTTHNYAVIHERASKPHANLRSACQWHVMRLNADHKR